MAANEQRRKRVAIALGGATLALVLLLAAPRAGAAKGGAGGGATGASGAGGDPDRGAVGAAGASPSPPEVTVWLRSGDRIELDGGASTLASTVIRARAVGRARVHATGDARVGWIRSVLSALREAQVLVLADASLWDYAAYSATSTPAASSALAEPRNAARRRRARANANTIAAVEPDPTEHAGEPLYAWQRGLDMAESRRLASSLNQAARDDEARRAAALARANPPAELRARVSLGGMDGTAILVDTEPNTGLANQAYRALDAAHLHIWDTRGSRIIVSSRDRGNNPRVVETRAQVVDALEAAGFVVEEGEDDGKDDAASSSPEVRNAARRPRNTLPRYDKRKGMWRGGDSRTIYAFTSPETGRTWVMPGQYTMNWGPNVTVRVATRAEAEELWQNPLHPGWTVDESPRNAASLPTHLAILQRIGNELFATKPMFGGTHTVLNTSASVQGAIAGAPPRGDLQVRGEYTSDGSHWGLGFGRVVALREQGKWIVG